MSIEAGRIEKFEGNKYKDCLLKKMAEFKLAYKDFQVDEKVDTIVVEINKLKPEQIMDHSHFGHIIGQLNIESAYAVRLEKLREKAHLSGSKEDEMKVKGCAQMVEEIKFSIVEYINLCLENKDYFYREISSYEGYFEEKFFDLGRTKKIFELNAKDFVLMSNEILEKKNKQ